MTITLTRLSSVPGLWQLPGANIACARRQKSRALQLIDEGTDDAR